MTRVRQGLTGDQLLAKLDQWLDTRPSPPNIFEVVRAGDVDLLAGFVLRGFRAAARQAVLDKISHYMGSNSRSPAGGPGSAVASLLLGLAGDWSLDENEQQALFGLETSTPSMALTGLKDDEVTTETLERASYLLDIFIATNALLSNPGRAAQWLRRPNSTPIFDGMSPLRYMIESLDQLRLVKRYVQAEAWGS